MPPLTFTIDAQHDGWRSDEFLQPGTRHRHRPSPASCRAQRAADAAIDGIDRDRLAFLPSPETPAPRTRFRWPALAFTSTNPATWHVQLSTRCAGTQQSDRRKRLHQLRRLRLTGHAADRQRDGGAGKQRLTPATPGVFRDQRRRHRRRHLRSGAPTHPARCRHRHDDIRQRRQARRHGNATIQIDRTGTGADTPLNVELDFAAMTSLTSTQLAVADEQPGRLADRNARRRFRSAPTASSPAHSTTV